LEIDVETELLLNASFGLYTDFGGGLNMEGKLFN
jgi:hypothetical protein